MALSYRECLGYLTLVPKLKDQWSWIKWSRELNKALNRINEDYWLILSGEKRKPALPTYTEYNDDEARTAVSERYNLPVDAVSSGHVTWYQEEIRQHNIALRKAHDEATEQWDYTNHHVLALLRSTLDDALHSHIEEARTVREAYLKLLATYGGTWQNVVIVYSEWSSLRFTESMTAQSFVTKFQSALEELKSVLPATALPIYLQFIQFIDAVRFHPNAHGFLSTITVETFTASSMDTAYDHFFRSGPY